MAQLVEDYPWWVVFVSNLVSLGVYLSGAYIIYQLGILWLVLYVFYILYLEVRLLGGHCVDCYYHGRWCAFGKGKISSLFFRKGSPEKFSSMNFSWKDMVPDLLVTLIPLLVGIVLLVLSFDWLILLALIVLVVLSTAGNGFVRGNLACKHCKQRGLGCPAEKLFDKRK